MKHVIPQRENTAMKRPLFYLLLFLSISPCFGGDRGGDADKAPASKRQMRAVFHSFREVQNPETKQQELVFDVNFPDLATPKQPVALRRGDKFAGYLVGEFRRRSPPSWMKDGTKDAFSELDLIDIETGETHTLVLDKICYLIRHD